MPLRAIHFATVRFNDKPTARHKCGPGWEHFTTRLDVAKLNMMLSSGSLETGTGSSNSLRSTIQSVVSVLTGESPEKRAQGVLMLDRSLEDAIHYLFALLGIVGG